MILIVIYIAVLEIYRSVGPLGLSPTQNTGSGLFPMYYLYSWNAGM